MQVHSTSRSVGTKHIFPPGSAAGGEGLALGGPETSVSFWVTLPLARSWVRATGMANCSTVNRDSHRLKRKRFLRAQPSALRFHFSPSPGPVHPFRARATLPVTGSREGCGWEGYGEVAEVPSWTTSWEFYTPLTAFILKGLLQTKCVPQMPMLKSWPPSGGIRAFGVDEAVKVGPSWMGFVPFEKRPQGAPSPLPPCDVTAKRWLSLNQDSTSACWHLDLGLPSLQHCEK